LFNNGLRRWISLGIVRPHRKAAIAELRKKLAHRALVPVQPEILLQPIAQIGSPPPDNLVRAGLRTRLDQRCDRLPWFGGKLRRTARRLPVLQTRKALRIIPVDPIAQRRAIHSRGCAPPWSDRPLPSPAPPPTSALPKSRSQLSPLLGAARRPSNPVALPRSPPSPPPIMPTPTESDFSRHRNPKLESDFTPVGITPSLGYLAVTRCVEEQFGSFV